MPISTIQNESNIDYLLWKSPISTITIGSQLIVHENEEALVFENGQLLNIFESGRHLIESGNIPGLEGLISRSFKGGSPIIVEIWFANKIASFDYKWGTRLQIKESSIPKYGNGLRCKLSHTKNLQTNKSVQRHLLFRFWIKRRLSCPYSSTP